MAEYPAAWGTTRDFNITVEVPEWDPDDLSDLSTLDITAYWRGLVFPNERGEIRHGTSGGTMPDTVVVRLNDRVVALADAFAHTLENQYCYDAEYFLIIRLREILEPDVWKLLPWPQIEPGDVFYAWDKFHGHEYSRTQGDASTMSYGGDWSDLQHYIDDHHPRPEGPRPTGPASAASLLRAVRSGDVAEVRALLAAGANPNAGDDAPYEALRSVSVDRDTSAMWEAISRGDPDLVEALLAAGARVHGPPGQYTPLHGAFLNRKLAVVPVLLRFGADPDLVSYEKTPRDLAAAIGPEALALLPPPKPRP